MDHLRLFRILPVDEPADVPEDMPVDMSLIVIVFSGLTKSNKDVRS